MNFRPFRTALLAGAIAASASSAYAATTGNLPLSGSIVQTCAISISPQTIATSLDLTSTQSNLPVANITEACNDKTGYKVTLNTTNGTTTGLFKGGAGNTDTLSYTVTYNGLLASFNGGSAQVTNVSTRSAPGGTVKAVAITYTGTSGIAADTYTDTLIVTLIAN